MDGEVCGDLAAAERREWWIGNGRGGYAAGTVAQTLTRRYHGLLIAPVDPPLGRCLVLAKADARLVVGDRRTPLFTNRWAGGAMDPEGYLGLEHFHLDGTVPVWRFAVGDRRIEQRIWMEPGANTTYTAWRLTAPSRDANTRLSVEILANGRDHHAETWPPGFVPEVAVAGDRLTMTAQGRFVLHVAAPGGSIDRHYVWVDNFDLPLERERGLSDCDHHLCIGRAELPLGDGAWHGLVASLDADASPDIEAALARRRAHDTAVLARALAVNSAARRRSGLGAAAGPRRRPICHRTSGSRRRGRAVGDRRLSLVRRLGARHDDRAAGPVPRDGAP